MLTSGQIKMARAALGWSIDVLAEKTSISSRTIKRIEVTIGIPKATAANLKLKTTPNKRYNLVFWKA